jgi:hypothetical protein
LCSYKCVCRSWYRVISESGHHKELPQFIAGFMFGNWKDKCRFTSFTGKYPSFSFLPFPIQDLVISYYYRGLFLCWCVGLCYVIYNPVTSKSVVLPYSNLCYGSARLGFDATISSQFMW